MNWKKINLYILFACASNWTVGLIMYLAHIKMDSILGVVLLAALYMPGPALATFIIQKYIYKKGFKEYGWTFDRKAIKWILFPVILMGHNYPHHPYEGILMMCLFTIDKNLPAVKY